MTSVGSSSISSSSGFCIFISITYPLSVCGFQIAEAEGHFIAVQHSAVHQFDVRRDVNDGFVIDVVRREHHVLQEEVVLVS